MKERMTDNLNQTLGNNNAEKGLAEGTQPTRKQKQTQTSLRSKREKKAEKNL